MILYSVSRRNANFMISLYDTSQLVIEQMAKMETGNNIVTAKIATNITHLSELICKFPFTTALLMAQ